MLIGTDTYFRYIFLQIPIAQDYRELYNLKYLISDQYIKMHICSTSKAYDRVIMQDICDMVTLWRTKINWVKIRNSFSDRCFVSLRTGIIACFFTRIPIDVWSYLCRNNENHSLNWYVLSCWHSYLFGIRATGSY